MSPSTLPIDKLIAAMTRCEAEHPIIDYVLPRDIALMAEGLALCRYKTLHEGGSGTLISLEDLRDEVVDAIRRWTDGVAGEPTETTARFG